MEYKISFFEFGLQIFVKRSVGGPSWQGYSGVQGFVVRKRERERRKEATRVKDSHLKLILGTSEVLESLRTKFVTGKCQNWQELV